MITIQNGKLTIPDNDRFVGFAGDNTVNTKQFFLLDRAKESCAYTLCLKFDNDAVCSVPLSAEVQGADTVLTWQIRREQLCTTGIVTAQLKTVDSDGSIAHSTKDFFIVASSVEFEDDDAESEYVTPSQLRNSINQALQSVSATAPYIGDDGYWYVYNSDADSFIRTEYHVSEQEVDSAMSDSSENPVGNRYIKQYVDDKADSCNASAKAYTDAATADKVENTRTIAELPLTADISSAQLASAIQVQFLRTNVIPNMTPGTKGMLGIGPNHEIFFCIEDNRWEHLVIDTLLNDKMNLIEEVAAGEIDWIDNGNLFISDGVLYLKHNGESIALVTGNDVYTKAEVDAKINGVYSKSEIDTMIGNVETLLAQI